MWGVQEEPPSQNMGVGFVVVVKVEVWGHASLEVPYIVGPLALLLHPHVIILTVLFIPQFMFITLMWNHHLSHYHSITVPILLV